MAATAICRNRLDTCWLLFEHCIEEIRADRRDEVASALSRVEAAAQDGLFAVGFVAYEAAAAFDDALQVKAGDGPLVYFALFESSREIADLQPWVDDQQSAADIPGNPGQLEMPRLGARFGKAVYQQSLAVITDYLQAGDCYQVNLTEPLIGSFDGSAAALFSRLYDAQPSRYSLFIDAGDFCCLSVSPELFFSVEGQQIRMQPMKGTRPRGESPGQDEALRAELVSSEKERSENLMIVDMIRNDLGRIAHPGSVNAGPLFELVALPTVWQQVSTVSAITDATLLQLFAALFPCASITGAPKARSMQIIAELEQRPRGVYTGAIGMLAPGRDWRFSVGIRTMRLERQLNTVTYGAGGGIVWGHDPEAEWQELIAKAAITRDSQSDFDLFETMRYEPDSGVLSQELHLNRLCSSAAHFGYPLEREAARKLLQSLDFGEARRIKLCLNSAGGFELSDFPLPAVKEEIVLCLAASPVSSDDPFLRHKTSNRQVYEQQRQLHQAGDDVLLWNERGEITESTLFNLLVEIDGGLFTPASDCGLLPGIARQLLLDTGEVKEAVISRDSLGEASRLWVCNSLRGRIPAVLRLDELD